MSEVHAEVLVKTRQFFHQGPMDGVNHYLLLGTGAVEEPTTHNLICLIPENTNTTAHLIFPQAGDNFQEYLKYVSSLSVPEEIRMISWESDVVRQFLEKRAAENRLPSVVLAFGQGKDKTPIIQLSCIVGMSPDEALKLIKEKVRV